MFRAMANNYTVRLGFLQTRPEINVVDYDYVLQSFQQHNHPFISLFRNFREIRVRYLISK